MFAYLKATNGPLEGLTFPLEARALVGRGGEADIQLTEGSVSRRHALILRLDDGRYWIGDLASTNGTFIGQDRIENHCLTPGDTIRVGKSVLIYSESPRAGSVFHCGDGAGFRLLSGPAESQTCGLPLSLTPRILQRQRKVARQEAVDMRPIPQGSAELDPEEWLGFFA